MPVNWASAIDLANGKPIEDPAKRTHEGVNVPDICPAALGGKDLVHRALRARDVVDA